MIKIADKDDIEIIARMRTEQQIEDWNFTSLNKEYSKYAEQFFDLTRNYLIEKLNRKIFFAIMVLNDIPVAMCAIEILDTLPQITACELENVRAGEVVAVYTRRQYRGMGYQQRLLKFLLDFAENEGFCDLVLTTNTDDAQHIYKKLGFRYISNKYYYKF